jgi:hypothetical protein
MGYDILKTKSINAGQSYTYYQYTFVRIDSNGELAFPAAGGYAVGVIQDKPAHNDPGSVCFPGDITKVQCGGVFSPGDDVATDSLGRAVAAVSGDYCLGVALTAGVTGAWGRTAEIIYQPKASRM